jgi:hypothetical protein
MPNSHIKSLAEYTNSVMPDVTSDEYGIFDRHPVSTWIPVPAPDPDPGFAGMTMLRD